MPADPTPLSATRLESAAVAKTFAQQLSESASKKHSWVCLGLDVELDRLPADLPRTVAGAERFLYNVVDACAAQVVAFKPNLAFYGALGPEGMALLQRLVAYINGRALVIADGKVGDVENTSRMYAVMLFDVFGFDCITANAYGGMQSLEPIINRFDRGTLIWTRSSNSGADELQARTSDDGDSIYLYLARRVVAANTRGNLGLVAGATRPVDIGILRSTAPELPILVPGVGAQRGELEACVRAGHRPPLGGLLMNAGRSALWATDGTDFADASARVISEMSRGIESAS